MDELIRLVAERTGLPEDKARSAVQVVLDQLRARLPGPIASQLESYLANGGTGGGGGLTDAIGGVFGSRP